MKQNLSSFQRNRDTLADADAHGRQRPPATRQAELKRRRACYARAGHAERMAQRDGAAIGIDAGVVVGNAEIAQCRQTLRGEGLVGPCRKFFRLTRC